MGRTRTSFSFSLSQKVLGWSPANFIKFVCFRTILGGPGISEKKGRKMSWIRIDQEGRKGKKKTSMQIGAGPDGRPMRGPSEVILWMGPPPMHLLKFLTW